ncbi:MAG TPA: TIGR03435 family protein [Bryobacteraceae bacterium]|jgi:uncharacterized protein (TIGR03435 family)
MNRVLLLVTAAAAVFAQTPGVRPAYEVASIKLNTSASNGSSSRGSQGQITFTNQTLKRLVERAYNVKSFQVTGPDWMESLHFDIVAKYPTDAENEARTRMLRTLLEDRFKLAAHLESKEMSGYTLVVAKHGFRLKPVEAGRSDTNGEGGVIRTLTAHKTSIAFLADLLARNLGSMVVDQTGIEGVYDFTLRWSPDDRGSHVGDAESAPSLFTAIQESLGLRLQAGKIPVDIVVVDHIEREPSEN